MPAPGAREDRTKACYGSRVFGLGMLEIFVIVGLAVLLFPPKELPKLARGVARIYGTVRRTADEFKTALLHDEDLREPFDEVKEVYDEARWEVRKVKDDARRELAKTKLEARISARKRKVEDKQVSRSAVVANSEPQDDVPDQARPAEAEVAVEPVEAVAPPPPIIKRPPSVVAPGASSDIGSREGVA